MSVYKSPTFIADVERQFEWYALHASWDVAERYLAAIEAAGRFLGNHPLLGPPAGLLHSKLRDWRFLVITRPFNKHVIFMK